MARPLLERPFWLDTSAPQRLERRDLPPDADVAVIGAGFTGLAAALALAKRGKSVTVVERHSVGWGASSRNGGMALTGLKAPVESLLARFGPTHARTLYDASLAAIDCVEALARAESIECDFVRCGHLEVACKPSHFAWFARSAEILQRDFGRSVRLLDRDRLRQEIGSERYHGGLLDELSAGLNPAKLVHGLAHAAKRAGATIVEETAVDGIDARQAGGRGFAVKTTAGTLRAADVFVATGAYTDAGVPALRKRVVPVGSYVIATEPLDARLATELIPHGRMIFDSQNFLHYYRLTPDRRMLFGGRAAFAPATERTIRGSASILRRGMIDVFPQLRDAAVEYAWGGTIDFTYDMLPHAGALDGIYYALGYAGHGVAMATYAGTQIARAIVGDRSDPDILGAGPVPAAPFGLHRLTPLMLPLAGAWFKFVDWAS